MIDVPLSAAGVFVTIATANDEDYSASSILDGNDQTFWMTTGLYPQAVTITFPQQIEIKAVKIHCFGIRNFVLEKSVRSHPIEFEPIAEKSLRYDERKMQVSDIQFPHSVELRHLKIIVLDGYDSFSAIQHLRIDAARNK